MHSNPLGFFAWSLFWTISKQVLKLPKDGANRLVKTVRRNIKKSGINCTQGFGFSSTLLYFTENEVYDLSWEEGKYKIPLELKT